MSNLTKIVAALMSGATAFSLLTNCGSTDTPKPTGTPTVMYTVILPPRGDSSPDGGIFDNN
jgi:hypothetical protein